MAFDKRGRWVPSEEITWVRPDKDATDYKEKTDFLRQKLTETGLDWRHEGKYAFRTDAWGELTEEQRFDVLEAYDTWYDSGFQENLSDEMWGLDIERGISYNAQSGLIAYKDDTTTWDAQTAFNMLAGGSGTLQVLEGTRDEIQHPYKYSEKVRHTVVGEHEVDGKYYTTIMKRDYPMDWKHYSHDELYRATIDELLEDHYYMFTGTGGDFDNATQVRAATDEIKSWVDEQYALATEEAAEDATAEEIGAAGEAKWKEYKLFQTSSARAHNQRYPEGDETWGYHRNQQVAIRKYQPWNRFDPETGTRTTVNPLTGEVRDTFKHTQVQHPTRMTISSNPIQDVDEGVFYSPTMDEEGKITASIMEANKTEDISKPTITNRTLKNYRPENFDSEWEVDGLESTTQSFIDKPLEYTHQPLQPDDPEAL
jgi:hypothetical protein